MSSQSTSLSGENTEKLEQLFARIVEIKNKDGESEDLEVVQEIVKESSHIVEDSKSVNEIILDAKILKTGSIYVNSKVTSLNTNLTAFREAEYVGGLLTYLKEQSGALLYNGMEWKSFAPLTYHLFKKSHPLSYMLGTFTIEPPPPKEKGKVERHKRTAEAEKVVLSSVEDREEAEEERSDIYDHILRWLVRHHKKNSLKPVSYFNFVMDPNSYWRSVENIFHFSFLVRDGRVKMDIINGIPYVEPYLDKSKGGRSEEEISNHQFCLTLSVPDWKKCIEKFNIEKAGIPPYAEK